MKLNESIIEKEKSCLNCRFCVRGLGTFVCLVNSIEVYLQSFNPCDKWLQYGFDKEKELIWKELKAREMIK